jgi:hypothetical protein
VAADLVESGMLGMDDLDYWYLRMVTAIRRDRARVLEAKGKP